MHKESVLVAMSGGVDSSVAAALLVEQGYRVVGVTMKTFCYGEGKPQGRTCCGLDGILDARRVAETLDIPHYVFDMEESFTASVIDDFVSEYAAGRTPNPCVRCNSNTKIPDLLERGRMLGCDVIATGHYARTAARAEGGVRVLRGIDPAKDQTYFLWGVPAQVAAHLSFPVGELNKAEVRARARTLGLVTADKPESQEICFVPGGDYTEFLADRLGSDHPALMPGRLVDTDGHDVGSHEGYGRYTIGQRRGLGGGHGTPLYVIGVRPERNEVVIGGRSALTRGELELVDLNWIAEPPATTERVLVQIRHRAAAAPAIVQDISAERASLRFETPQRAVTPGQSGAVYRGDELIGGGRIR
ncbi:MAG: tRNA 2-thiouridine(34) synthase MnmA [Longimicrobiales bacterium]